MTVHFNGSFYELNLEDGTYYTFDVDEADIDHIDRTIEAWTRWRSYVVKNGVTPYDD